MTHDESDDGGNDSGKNGETEPEDESFHAMPRSAITDQTVVCPIASIFVAVIPTSTVASTFPIRTRLDVRLRRIVCHSGRAGRIVDLGIVVPQGITIDVSGT